MAENKITFDDVLKKLDIAEYGERIFKSNSHGELFHINDYLVLSKLEDISWFRDWFVQVVKYAEENWDRPESVFQHIPKLLKQSLTG